MYLDLLRLTDCIRHLSPDPTSHIQDRVRHPGGEDCSPVRARVARCPATQRSSFRFQGQQQPVLGQPSLQMSKDSLVLKGVILKKTQISETAITIIDQLSRAC